MKVSIILPVYNGQETLKKCLEAILNIEYQGSDYELVVVNDGSVDSTKNIINSFLPKYKEEGVFLNHIDFERNKGRIKARMTGAENSSYDNLLFIDHRCIVESDILSGIKNKDYEPLIGNPYQEREGSLIMRFFYMFRKFLYRPYWGEEYPDVYIDEKNFDKIAKGFSPFFTNKERFFDALPEDKGKWVSDDTLIFSNMIKEKKILKTSEVKCLYKERTQGMEFFCHMFQRGPRFVDFYWNPKSRYFFLIPSICVLPFVLVGGVLLFKSWFLIGILVLLLIYGGYLLFRGYDFLDMLSVLIITPLVLLAFGSGVYMGVLRKIFVKRSRS